MTSSDTTAGHAPAYRFDADRSLISYVAEVALIQPDAPALLFADRVVSYGELLDRADFYAAAFQDKGAGPGGFVGLLMSRSVDCIAGMLGALRAGAGYVPLDPSYASESQLGNIVSQIPFAAVLVDPVYSAISDRLIDADVVLPVIGAGNSDPGPKRQWSEVKGSDPAYLVFTSGTTGQPKGVILPNRGLASFSLDQTVFSLGHDDIMMHATSMACDGGLLEVWPALLNGAALAIVDGAKPTLQDMANTMTRHKVTVTFQYIGMHQLLVDHHIEAFKTVRLALTGGDIMAPDHARHLKAACPDLSFVNLYGPSEASCISLGQEVTGDLLTGQPIPIGKPLVHECAFIVDEGLHEAPVGQLGQLVIGGPGVALGYYNMPEKTAAAFVADPRPGHSGIVYLTGDLAKIGEDGRFAFAGRADRQIKLGGRRIELDGIEHVLRGCDGVHNAIVEVVRSTAGDRRICAAIQPETEIPADHDLFVRNVLTQARQGLHPEFLPKVNLTVPDLPLTKMGKPDRKAVRSLLEAKMNSSRAASPSTNGAKPALTPGKADRPGPDAIRGIRDVIAGIWDDLLQCGPVADTSTFFEAGGNSLQLIDAHARMEKALHQRFDLTLMFETPRLGDLATTLAQLCTPKTNDPENIPDKSQANRTDLPEGAIAIIGLAARVPGADTLDEFWQHILQGDNLIQRFDPSELEDIVDPATRASPNYVPARSILKDVDKFDAKYFGILPREAQRMDPQARVFLELCVQALDDAGLDPARAPGRLAFSPAAR